MKTLKSTNILSLILGVFCLSVLFTPSIAQEYDDMYFNKSDRKTVKVEKAATTSALGKNNPTSDYKKITESTETYSAKNINPEYIARYKSTESNEVNEQINKENSSYTSDDYFVEGYDRSSYVSDSTKNNIDYTALALRDQMSYSNHNRSYSRPSWRFSPYMSMGMGMGMGGMGYGGYGYPSYGYDPFMMGYGSGMNMGIGFGSGFGYSPSMAYNVGMSWGTGYNPWGGWGGYPGYYNPYRMNGYDPFRSMYGYNSYGRGFGGSPYYGGGYYGSGYYGGGYPSVMVVSSGGTDRMNGRRMEYKPRTNRSSAAVRTQTSSENSRVASTNSRVRIPSRATSTSNGRVSRDYSKIQNENYSRSARSSSSSQRLTTSSSSRSSYTRNSGYSRNTSSISNNKPSRTSNYSSGNSRSYSGRSSYSSGSKSMGRSSGSFSSPSKSSSSYSSGSRSSSSFSSGSSSGRSSSGSSSSGGTRSSGGGGSRGSRQ